MRGLQKDSLVRYKIKQDQRLEKLINSWCRTHELLPTQVRLYKYKDGYTRIHPSATSRELALQDNDLLVFVPA